MTLFEAQPYDPARARKKRQLIVAIIGAFALILLLDLLFHLHGR